MHTLRPFFVFREWIVEAVGYSKSRMSIVSASPGEIIFGLGEGVALIVQETVSRVCQQDPSDGRETSKIASVGTGNLVKSQVTTSLYLRCDANFDRMQIIAVTVSGSDGNFHDDFY